MISKMTFGAAVFVVVAGTAQAQNMNADCTEENITKAQSQIDGMTSEGQKAQKMAAMADIEKAKEAMQAKNMADCKTHMEKVMKAVMQG